MEKKVVLVAGESDISLWVHNSLKGERRHRIRGGRSMSPTSACVRTRSLCSSRSYDPTALEFRRALGSENELLPRRAVTLLSASKIDEEQYPGYTAFLT